MLRAFDAVPTVGVHDLDIALGFYRDRLGLAEIGRPAADVVSLRAGNTRINLYRAHQAGLGATTAITWEVGDRLDEVVSALRSAGVWFASYQAPDDPRAEAGLRFASFKDPDGNLLCLVNR